MQNAKKFLAFLPCMLNVVWDMTNFLIWRRLCQDLRIVHLLHILQTQWWNSWAPVRSKWKFLMKLSVILKKDVCDTKCKVVNNNQQSGKILSFVFLIRRVELFVHMISRALFFSKKMMKSIHHTCEMSL